MNKSVNRRDFIKSSILGLGALAVSFSPLRLLAQNSTASGSLPTTADALALCRQARELFYQKKYDDAAAIYNRLIAAFPARIEYYDAYAKVFGARQQSLETAELYLKGVSINPENPYFKHRLSLWLRRLAAGNRKAAEAYQNRYGIADLWQQSAKLLIAAVAVKPVKDFILDLCDFQAAIDRQNKINEKYGYPSVVFPEEYFSRINELALPLSDKWKGTRMPRRENFEEAAIDTSAEKLKNRKRRNLYSDSERKAREKAVLKSLKKRYTAGLDAAIEKDIPGQVDKYGLKIADEIADDTQTIGKLRKYYCRRNFGNRIITLNRLLYSRNGSIANTLALASALAKYGNSKDIREGKQLADTVAEYAADLPPVYFACYYTLRSQICLKENNAADARNILLEGIRHFGGYGGMAYTMMENYAMTYSKNEAEKGVKIMKALCGKEFDGTADSAIRQYVENYRNTADFRNLNAGEQLKHLYALAKLQKQQKGGEYKATQAEIKEVKNRLKEL